MRLDIYVNCRGRCEEAFRFYEQHLGGRITGMIRHREQPSPNIPADWHDKVLHARIEIGATVLMEADIPQAEPMQRLPRPLGGSRGGRGRVRGEVRDSMRAAPVVHRGRRCRRRILAVDGARTPRAMHSRRLTAGSPGGPSVRVGDTPGASIAARVGCGDEMTPLMKAVQKNDAAAVRSLIAGGADVNALDPNGDAPLVMAAYKGYADIVRLLLEAGADVAAVDPGMKATALHAAAYAGRTEAARVLIEGGIDIDKQGPRNGYTALHDAIWQNNVDTARVLIDAGASLDLASHDGQTPLAFARAQRRTEIAALIEQRLTRG